MATWNEADHPRDDEGKFTYKGGGGSSKILYGGVEYNDMKEDRENILYNDSSLKTNLSNYRNKLVNFLDKNLDRAEILFSTVAELENKILDNTISTMQVSREKLTGSINKLSRTDFKSTEEYKNLVNKARKTYRTLNDFEVKTNNMFKINTQKEGNGHGMKAMSDVLKFQKAIENECNEIFIAAKNITNQKINKKNDLINMKPTYKNEKPEKQSTENKKESTIEQSQIKSSPKTNNEKQISNSSTETKANWIMPCNGRISSYYGNRKPPVNGASTFHSGIDIAVPVGTPVKAITTGKVRIASGGITGYGNAIYVNHGNINGKIVESEYGHLSKIYVVKGQNVEKGQIIGLSGGAKGTPGSGYSSGPHLHLTIREYDLNMKNKKHEDPGKYLKYN